MSTKLFQAGAIYRLCLLLDVDSKPVDVLFRVDKVSKTKLLGHMIDYEGKSHLDKTIAIGNIAEMGRVTNSQDLNIIRQLMRRGK